jgi:hypothetical protein
MNKVALVPTRPKQAEEPVSEMTLGSALRGLHSETAVTASF